MSKTRKLRGYGWPFNKSTQTSKELIDYDYLDKLTKEELEWLKAFTQAEYLNDHAALKKLKKRNLTKKEKKILNRKNYVNRNDAFHRRVQTQGEIQSKDSSSPLDKIIEYEELQVFYETQDPDSERE